MLLLAMLLFWAPQRAPQLLTTDEAIQYVEINPEIIEFAANRDEQPLTIIVSDWIAEQPDNYSGTVAGRIRDRRRNKEDVDQERKTILDKINQRRKELKEAKAELQDAKAEKWKSFAAVIYASAVLLGVLFAGLIVYKVFNVIFNAMGWE